MTLEEVKQKLKVFDKYTFEEDTHTYYCNGGEATVLPAFSTNDKSQLFHAEDGARPKANGRSWIFLIIWKQII